MENLELENKAVNVTKTTKKEVKVTVVPKESGFVTAETIKLVEDGIFGNKTEEALMYWVNKKSIDNQSDLNYLNNKINPSIDSFVK